MNSSRFSAMAAGSLALIWLQACGAGPPLSSPTPSLGDGDQDEVLVLGEVTREEVEMAMPEWVSSVVDSEPDLEASLRLADLSTDARITVFFGSWCSDSQREMSRLWKAFDLAGGEPRFPIRYIGVDRSKAEPAVDLGGRTLLYVPTFVVEDGDGVEVGQLIEESPRGVELDLLALLTGEAQGWISARDDLPKKE